MVCLTRPAIVSSSRRAVSFVRFSSSPTLCSSVLSELGREVPTVGVSLSRVAAWNPLLLAARHLG